MLAEILLKKRQQKQLVMLRRLPMNKTKLNQSFILDWFLQLSLD